MTLHELKIHPAYFEAVLLEEKTFEVREDDRGFETGDELRLREWDPGQARYTGRIADRRVLYILRGPWRPPGATGDAIGPGFVVMAIDY
jgi:hypothetical protein